MLSEEETQALEKGPQAQLMMPNGSPVAQDLGRQSGNQGIQTLPGHMQEGSITCSCRGVTQDISDRDSHRTKSVHNITCCCGNLSVCPDVSPSLPTCVHLSLPTKNTTPGDWDKQHGSGRVMGSFLRRQLSPPSHGGFLTL